MDQQNINQENKAPTGDDLASKRYAARIAMEDESAKARREAEEKIKLDRELKEKEEKQKEAERILGEQKAAQEKEEAEKKAKEAALREGAAIKGEVEKIKTVGPQINPLRTLKDDMDTMIKEQSISLARIAMQEDIKRREAGIALSGESSKKTILIGLSISLILIGAGIGGYIYYKQMVAQEEAAKAPIVKTITFEPLIYSEIKKVIHASGMSQEKLMSEVKTEISNFTTELGKVKNISITKNIDSETISEITAGELLGAMRSGAPSDLIRSLDGRIMVGVVTTLDGYKSGFLMFRTSSYQKAFAGMLKWEQGTMIRDVYETITGILPDGALVTKKFEDLVTNNQDARVIKDDNGRVVLSYGFLNNKTIVIAGNIESFNEIVTRFRNSGAQ